MFISQDFLDAQRAFRAAASAFYASFPHDASDLAVQILLETTCDPNVSERFGAFLGRVDNCASHIKAASGTVLEAGPGVDTSAVMGTVPIDTMQAASVIGHLRDLEAEAEEFDSIVMSGIWAVRMQLLTALGRQEDIAREFARIDAKLSEWRT